MFPLLLLLSILPLIFSCSSSFELLLSVGFSCFLYSLKITLYYSISFFSSFSLRISNPLKQSKLITIHALPLAKYSSILLICLLLYFIPFTNLICSSFEFPGSEIAAIFALHSPGFSQTFSFGVHIL